MKRKRDGEKRELPENLRVAIGKEVVKLRGDEAQGDFEDRCKMGGGNLSRIESGRQAPSLHTLYHIGVAAGVKMYQILAPAEGESTIPYQQRLTTLERDLIVALRDNDTNTAHALVTRIIVAEKKGTPSLLIDDYTKPSNRHFREGHGPSYKARKGGKKKRSRN